MGISLDEASNAVASGNVAEIQTDGAAVKVLVIQTDEEREIARQTILSIEKT
jgi:acetate kinase